MIDQPDPYRVLGVDYGAAPEAISAAYRGLARSHHPDVSQDPGAEHRMAEINAAWSLLRDPRRRAAYDRDHGIADGMRGGRPDNPLAALGQHANGGHHAAVDPTAREPGRPVAPDRPQQVVWRRGPDGEGAAGPPPGNPRGSVLPFGRHIGWSLGEVARVDPGYLQWLAARPDGRPYRAEIEALIGPLLGGADGRGADRGADRGAGREQAPRWRNRR